jgi:hypothetical protein
MHGPDLCHPVIEKNGRLSAVQTLFAGHLSEMAGHQQGPRVGYAQLASY